jgi:cyclophilin family peptidyl-prolyl cis-trans isomerase
MSRPQLGGTRWKALYHQAFMATSKRQRQKENRALRLEEERKAAQKAARIRTVRNITILVLVVLGPLLLISFLTGDDDTEATTTTSTSGASTTIPGSTTTTSPEQARLATSFELFAGQPTACGAEQPPEPSSLSFDAAEDQEIPADATVTALLATSCGEITLELDQTMAPETVNSFVFLARQGYFDGSPMHRIIPTFMMQGGDPTGTGTGDPGYSPVDEFPPLGTPYAIGDVAMANSGPESAGSQFFIVLEENTLHQNLQFTTFGRVIGSEETLAAISAVPLALNQFDAQPSRPLESVWIESVTVTVG